MPKGKRGYKFTAPELEILAGAIEEIVPISAPEIGSGSFGFVGTNKTRAKS